MKQFAKNNIEILKKRNAKALHHIHTLKESAAFFFGLSILIVTLSLVFHTIPKAKSYKETRQNIVEANYSIRKLQKEKKEKSDKRDVVKEDYEKLKKQSEPLLNVIFPEDEEISQFTAFLEDFAVSYHSEENPFELSTISYGTPKMSANGEYYVLPVRTSIEVSEANFVNFLEVIERSGSLNNKDFFRDKPIRLMSVETININVPTEEEVEKVKVYSFNLELKIYFRGTNYQPKNL
jgi:hypothetical protein